ncbi:MerR family transcriptional regulator [Bacillus cereus]|uniref:MerR family transcriptional regulator n=1 Tax=Bacillus TaxID=1386 RepID=UPI00065B922B|nr:MerR family transcriptional regulator [Bacillus cereus]KMQ22147.1 MerR family transcriptional regulator [Bacillus cereus]MCI3150099.1 MerR family transcriptional regulator [Bacillus cereus]WHS75959.1 MerR family transcriptional regulator [Bacillus cereus]
MTFTIKEISTITNVSASTLRYYENEGLLPVIKRDNNGNRLYTEDNIEWINLLLALRLTGMPIKEIKKYIELYYQGSSTLNDRKKMMLQHKKRVENEITQTYKHLEKINYKLAVYDTLEAQLNKKKVII